MTVGALAGTMGATSSSLLMSMILTAWGREGMMGVRAGGEEGGAKRSSRSHSSF
jgi:hypothetical protein